MCAYYVPDPVRAAIEQLLEKDITSTAVIVGRLHTYEFAVEIEHRFGVVDQVKSNYYNDHPELLYEISETPLSDTALEAALE